MKVFVSFSGWVVDDRGCRTPDGGVGDCIAIKKCESMLNFLQTVKRPYSTYLVNKLQAYTCSYGTDVRVCCPSEPINIVEPGIERSELSAGPPDVSKNKNLKLLPKDCGFLDIGNKIKNGMNALMNEFPWMALLSYKTSRYAHSNLRSTAKFWFVNENIPDSIKT